MENRADKDAVEKPVSPFQVRMLQPLEKILHEEDGAPIPDGHAQQHHRYEHDDVGNELLDDVFRHDVTKVSSV